MKKKLITLVNLIALSSITGGAYAGGTTWDVFMYADPAINAVGALDFNGAPIADGICNLIVDTNNNGLGEAKTDSWLWDANDIILATSKVGVDGYAGEAYPGAKWDGIYQTGMDSTDDLYLVWFDKPFTDPLPSGPGYATHYGVEKIGQVGVGNVGNPYSFYPLGGNATFSTPAPAAIPEPSTLTLLAVGAIGLVARRRRA